MRALGYLSINDKGRQKMLLADAKASQLYQKKLKVNELKVAESQNKVDLAIYRKQKDLEYRDKAKKLAINEKLKAKYGLTKSRYKKKEYNYVKGFRKFNDLRYSKIIPKGGIQDQFLASHQNVIPQERASQRWNPFAHRDPIDVYGDDGLTLFDGDKHADDDTGGLFGFSSKRRF